LKVPSLLFQFGQRSEVIVWFQIRDKKGAYNFRCRLFKVSASKNFSAIANLLLGHAAGIVQHECEFAATGSDRCNRPGAVAVVTVSTPILHSIDNHKHLQ